ncbi:MAG: hypothetical protein JXR70_10705 [Spirochaetales bacterium]|nr:hypothetical protein [Spirochaetales bacterium]
MPINRNVKYCSCLFILFFFILSCGSNSKDNSQVNETKFSDTSSPLVCWEQMGPAGFSKGIASFVNLFIDNGQVYVAFQDGGDGSRISVMTYDKGKWTLLGSRIISPERAEYPSLYVENGIVYLAFQDIANGGKASVVKYENNNWSSLGERGISEGIAEVINLEVKDGVPYLAFRDSSNGQIGLTVMAFLDKKWQILGRPQFSDGLVFDLDIAVDSKGTVYAVYCDDNKGRKTTAKAFVNGSWSSLGEPGFSKGSIQYLNLSLSEDVPYVAYTDQAIMGKAVIKVYNKQTQSWEAFLGLADSLTSEQVVFLTMYVEKGKPYLGFVDKRFNMKATVIQYQSGQFILKGSPGFSEGRLGYLKIFVSQGGVYAAFSDGTQQGRITVFRCLEDSY